MSNDPLHYETQHKITQLSSMTLGRIKTIIGTLTLYKEWLF